MGLIPEIIRQIPAEFPVEILPGFDEDIRMKTLTIPLLLLLAACTSPQKRIEKNPELFASFSPEVQESLKAGKIDLGFEPKMVEIALGKPDRTYTRKTAEGTETVWVYIWLNKYSYTQSVSLTGVRGSAWVNVDDIREVPYKTITFVEGKVVEIEELEQR